jgi:hypothetical protein
MFVKTFGMATALMLSASLAMACPGKEGDCKDGQCKLKKNDIATILKLEGDRAEQLRAMQKKHHAELKALKEENHASMATVRENHKLELSSLLSEDEMQKVEAVMAERHKHHGDHHGGHHASPDKGHH